MSLQEILLNLSKFPYYSELVSFFGGFAVKVFYDIYEDWKGSMKDQESYNKEIFRRIRDEILPYEMMIFFRDFNAKESFSKDYIYSLIGFVDTNFRDSRLRFLDKNLENIKVGLFQDINNIVYELSIETFALENNHNFQAVPKEWRIDAPERYERVTNILQQKARNTWKSYEEFLDSGRKKLRV